MNRQFMITHSGYFHKWVLFSAALLLGVTPAKAEEPYIPDSYELGEGTLSPNKLCGVLYPLEDNTKGEYPPNLLVRFKPYQVLAEIRPGVRRGATLELFAEWSGNSTVALYHFRKWGLVDLWVFEIPESGPAKRQDVLDEARKIFRKDIRSRLLQKYPKESETIIFVSSEGEENPMPDFKFQGRQLLLDLHADNKPNGAGGPHWTAELKAVWDFGSGKFTKIQFKPGPIEIRKNP